MCSCSISYRSTGKTSLNWCSVVGRRLWPNSRLCINSHICSMGSRSEKKRIKRMNMNIAFISQDSTFELYAVIKEAKIVTSNVFTIQKWPENYLLIYLWPANVLLKAWRSVRQLIDIWNSVHPIIPAPPKTTTAWVHWSKISNSLVWHLISSCIVGKLFPMSSSGKGMPYINDGKISHPLWYVVNYFQVFFP